MNILKDIAEELDRKVENELKNTDNIIMSPSEKKIDMENKQYKEAFEGFYREMMGTLGATSRAREVNPNDEFIKTINDAYIGVVKRINWWKEKFDIPVDEDSPKMEY